MRPWAMWRRIQYGGGVLTVLAGFSLFIYVVYIYAPPTCFDRVLNGNETGIDCGGGCVRICATDVMMPEIEWAESFRIVNGQYNAVAYINNRNQEAANPEVAYTFRLFDGEEIIAERSGKTILPPNGVYPIFEGRVRTLGGRTPTETSIEITPSDLWIPAQVGRDEFRSSDIELIGAGERPRLNVLIENTQLTTAEDVEVVATIFNFRGEPVTASQTIVEEMPARSQKDVVFTWPEPIAKTVRSCIIPTDVVLAIDLSGSMNNDGDNPPQPVTDALSAASTFVNSLKEKDQAGVVSFATDARLEAELSDSINLVANNIVSLRISPEAEVGFTNTLDALRVAGEELRSERVNPDARRVLVLLTDGLPTAPGDEEIMEDIFSEVEFIKNENVVIYAIGLGSEVDKSFIDRIASSRQNSYIAPNRSDLNRIYATITTDLCEVGPSKIDVLPKTDTYFTPLR